MATNKTDFLNLNDWVGTDPFRREEINANFRSLDAKAKEHDDSIGSLSKAASEYEWTSTAGQLIYVMPSGQTYDPTTKWFEVTVGGARVPLSQVQMDSSTQFTLLVDSADIPADVKVVARWTEPYVPATAGHHTKHEVGGADEIDLTKLKNYQEYVAAPLAEIANLTDHTITYSYYPDGNIQTVTEKDSSNNVIQTVTYTYNASGDVSASATVKNGKTYTTTYNYDVSGNIQSTSNVIS